MSEVANQGESPRVRRGRPGYDADQLLSVAVDVFTKRGYDGTTMDDLAAALGLSKSSIYHHVSGKKELLARALDRALDSLEAALAVDDEHRPVEQLEAAVQASVRVLITELPFVTLLLRVRGNTEVERAALARRRRIDAAFAALVVRAQQTGDLRADVQAPLVARLVFGTVNSLVEWYRPGRGVHPEDLVNAVCHMVFDGLRTR